jgi:hypothetical protein
MSWWDYDLGNAFRLAGWATPTRVPIASVPRRWAQVRILGWLAHRQDGPPTSDHRFAQHTFAIYHAYPNLVPLSRPLYAWELHGMVRRRPDSAAGYKGRMEECHGAVHARY